MPETTVDYGIVVRRISLDSLRSQRLPLAPIYASLPDATAATRLSFKVNVVFECVCRKSSWLTLMQLELRPKSGGHGWTWWRCPMSHVARSRQRAGQRSGVSGGADELGDALEPLLVEVVDWAVAEELPRHE